LSARRAACCAQQQQGIQQSFAYAGNREIDVERVSAFLRGLKEGGFVDGQNVALEYRWAEQQYDRMPASPPISFAAKSPDRRDGRHPFGVAAKAATANIPILIAIGGDPVKLGLVPSLNRRRHLTGVSFLLNAMGAKQLEALHETVPKTVSIAFLEIRPIRNARSDKKNAEAARRRSGVKLCQPDTMRLTPRHE